MSTPIDPDILAQAVAALEDRRLTREQYEQSLKEAEGEIGDTTDLTKQAELELLAEALRIVLQKN